MPGLTLFVRVIIMGMQDSFIPFGMKNVIFPMIPNFQHEFVLFVILAVLIKYPLFIELDVRPFGMSLMYALSECDSSGRRRLRFLSIGSRIFTPSISPTISYWNATGLPAAKVPLPPMDTDLLLPPFQKLNLIPSLKQGFAIKKFLCEKRAPVILAQIEIGFP